MDYNKANSDRFFFRASGNTFLEAVSDWTYEVPAFAGLHSIDRTRYNWAVIGNWTHTSGATVIDTQVASNRFFQDDLLKRLHEYKPTDMGLPPYLDSFCQAQNDCMLPSINIGGYQGISQGSELRGHDHERSGHGQPHAGRRARTRCEGASMLDSRSACVVRAATPPGSSRSPTSSRARPATRRSSHRATSG